MRRLGSIELSRAIDNWHMRYSTYNGGEETRMLGNTRAKQNILTDGTILFPGKRYDGYKFYLDNTGYIAKDSFEFEFQPTS